MKKGHKILIVFGLVAMAGGAIYFATKRGTMGEQSAQVREPINKSPAQLRQEAEAVLLSKSPQTAAALARSLIILARVRDPLARQEATKFVGSGDALVQSAAIFTLGYFDDDETHAQLAKILASENERNKREVLKSLPNTPTIKRAAFIKSLKPVLFASTSGGPGQSKICQVFYLNAALKAESDTTLRVPLVNMLLALAKDQDPSVQSLAYSKLQEEAPQSEQTLKYSREQILRGSNPDTVIQAWQHLTLQDQDFLRAKIPDVLASERSFLKPLALQSMSFLCPPSRYTQIEQVIKKDRDRSVVFSAIDTLVAFSDAESLALIKRLDSQANGFEQMVSERLTTARDAIESRRNDPTRVVPCAQN